MLLRHRCGSSGFDMAGAPQPLVSVVIPTFNSEATIEETLRSAGQQTYGNIEIIIVDDGSADSTAALVSLFCEKDERARLILVRHGGVGATRNIGISAAKGEFVAFLDSDDIWHPAKIEKQVAKALSIRGVGFVYTFYLRIDQRGDHLNTPQQFEVTGWAFWRHLYWNFVGSASSILARRSALLSVGCFSEESQVQGGEDYLLQLTLAAQHPIACVPEILLYYRDTPSSLSSDHEETFRAWLKVTDILRKRGYLRRNRVIYWTYSRACWGLAIACGRRGRLIRAAQHFFWAIYGDPRRTFLNATRVLARLVRMTTPVPGAPVTYALDGERIERLARRDAASRRPPRAPQWNP